MVTLVVDNEQDKTTKQLNDRVYTSRFVFDITSMPFNRGMVCGFLYCELKNDLEPTPFSVGNEEFELVIPHIKAIAAHFGRDVSVIDSGIVDMQGNSVAKLIKGFPKRKFTLVKDET